MADTGSPNDLIGRSDVPKGCKIIQLDDDDKVELNTAGGTIYVTSSTEIPCTVLNEIIEPLVLDDSPTVLSIGKRVVHHGYDFVWRHGSKPYFKLQDGTKIRMEIVDDVPYIRTRVKQRTHSAAIAVPNRAVAMVAVKGCQAPPTVLSDSDESSDGPPPPLGFVDSDSECDEESPSDSEDDVDILDGTVASLLQRAGLNVKTKPAAPASSSSATSRSSADSGSSGGPTLRSSSGSVPASSNTDSEDAAPPEVAASDDDDQESDTDDEHDITHRVKNKSCRGCTSGKAKRSRRTRKGPDSPHKQVKKFGEETTVDLFQTHHDEDDWGISDERYGAVFYD